jgi:hypothetical protein
MDNTEQLLAQLRDIHLPAAVALAPWPFIRYVTLALIFLLCLGVVFLFWKHRQRQRSRAIFLRELRALQTGHDFASLSVLLKRIALYRYPADNVGSLEGEAWLAFLDRTQLKNTSPPFQSDIGRLLLVLPYQAHSTQENCLQEDRAILWTIIEAWALKNYL